MSSRGDEFLDFLAELNQLPEEELDESSDFELAISKLYKKLRKRNRRRQGQQRKRNDRRVVREIATARDATAGSYDLPDGAPIEFEHKSRTCYSCNKPYRTVHPNYHWLCVPCGNLSASKRTQTANLKGYRALLTGGRIKIGFQTACWLLRSGATVDITTRFPKNAATRFAELDDFASFRDRLRIYSVDFRNLQELMQFIADYAQQTETLEILIHCAAQSVRRSQAWQENLLRNERNATLTSEQSGLLGNLPKSPLHAQELFAPTESVESVQSSEAESAVSQLSLLLRDDDDREICVKGTLGTGICSKLRPWRFWRPSWSMQMRPRC